jgi:MFS family permease
MVGLAFLAFNIGLTVVVNTFGPVLPVLQRELGASRAGVSMAFGLLMLTMGLLAPVVGNLTNKVKLRTMMMAGAAAMGLGFFLLAFARTLTEVILLYGVLLGPGACFLALIPSPTLISRWFQHDRGKALGLGLVQVLALVVAPISAALLASGGRPLLFLTIAAVFAVLVPVMGLVIDWPEQVGQTPRRAPTAAPAGPTSAAPILSSRTIFTDGRFWLVSIAVGIFTAAGVTMGSHGPAMAVAKGISPGLAATVLSGTGAGALVGALGFGWMIDRIGPFRTLIVAMVFTALVWLLFSMVSTLPMMVLLAFFLGVNVGPTQTIHSACLNEIFGAASFGRAMGYSYFIKLPFLVAPAPLAGRLFDLSGGYSSTYAVMVTAMVVASALAFLLAVGQRRHVAAQAAPAPSLS